MKMKPATAALIAILAVVVMGAPRVVAHPDDELIVAQAAAKPSAKTKADWKSLASKARPKPTPEPAPTQPNIITNSGFEKGADEWTIDAKGALVTQPKQVHAGSNCVMLAVDKLKFYPRVETTVSVRKGRFYRLVFWARSTGQPGAAAWFSPSGKGMQDKVSIGSYKSFGPQWARYEGAFTAPVTGEIGLWVNIRANKFGKPGKAWIDDVALYEYDFSAPTPVSNEVGFNDFPSLARAADGSLYVSWLSFRDGFDSLQVARFRRDGDAFSRLGAWSLEDGEGTYLYAPRVVATDKDVVSLCASEVKGVWRIVATPCGSKGPGSPVVVASGKSVDTKPVGAWDGKALWVAWESNDGGVRQVRVVEVRDGKVSNADMLSAKGVSSYDPTIVALPDGQIAVAWHAFVDGNYDVHFTRRASNGKWAAPRRLTKAPSIDRHAELLARGSELWVVYENASMNSYSIGAASNKRLIAARITDTGLEAPAGWNTSPMYQGGEAAAPIFDESGRLWVAFSRPRSSVWDLNLTSCMGREWLPATLISTLRGMDRRPGLVIDGDRAVFAFQADNIPNKYSNIEETLATKSDIHLSTYKLASAPAASAMTLEPIAEPTVAFTPGTLRTQYGDIDKPKTESITYKGETLYLYYGDLHDHTEVSICNRVRDESIDEAYADMRDITSLDFACVTDHGYNLTAYLWNHTAKMARLNDDPGRFLTFLGEEWTSTFEEYSDEHPYGFYGHRNLVFEDSYFPRWWNARNYDTPAKVWAELREMNANFVHIPHQIADTGNVPVDWNYHDEEAQPVAEIFQGRGSYEYLGAPRMARSSTPTKGAFIQDAWAQGVVIGVIASPDHGGGRGKACVYAPELTRKAILDAIRKRHTFGSTASRMLLDVRVNGALMGEKIAASGGKPVNVEITARCPGAIKSVEVCRNNKFIYTTSPGGNDAKFTFVDEKPLDEPAYYYVRLIQEDNEIAWSSPVWLGYK